MTTSTLPLACPACGDGALIAQESGALCSFCGHAFDERRGILHLVTGRRGAPSYRPHELPRFAAVEETHFWFLARREAILAALRRLVPDLASRPLLDLGCGTGALATFLERSGVPLALGCDAHLEGLAIARERTRAPLALVDEGWLPPLRAGQRLIGLFDVLEHIDDDQSVLEALFRSLAPGGVLVITVPAHPFLFDEMDELAHHRRRYTRLGLEQKLRLVGFELRLITHFMATLVPLLVVARALGRALTGPTRTAERRRWQELRVIPMLNGLLLALLRAERWLARGRSLRFGTSLLAIAVHPAGRAPTEREP